MQDGNKLYTNVRSKGTLGAIKMPVVRAVGDHLVTKKLFTVHEERTSWRFDPYGGSMDSEGNFHELGSLGVCIAYNTWPSISPSV